MRMRPRVRWWSRRGRLRGGGSAFCPSRLVLSRNVVMDVSWFPNPFSGFDGLKGRQRAFMGSCGLLHISTGFLGHSGTWDGSGNMAGIPYVGKIPRSFKVSCEQTV